MGAGTSSSAPLQHRRLLPLGFLAGLGLQPVVRTQTVRVLDGVIRPGARVDLQEQPLAEFEEPVADGVVARGLSRLVLEGGGHRRWRQESSTGSRGLGVVIWGELG